MSKKFNNIFSTFIQEGYEAAKLIQDPANKATAYAALANAIATAGLVETNTDINLEEKESTTATKGKDSLKAESSKGTKKTSTKKKEEPVAEEEPTVEEPQEEEVKAEEPQSATVENKADADDWEAPGVQDKYAEQLGRLQAYVDAWGEDYVYGEALSYWSEGAFNSADSIRPSNIDGFLVYLDSLCAEAN